MKRTIVWFRKDLRIHDHAALWEASQQGIVIPLFIWSEQDRAEYGGNEATSWWLYHSLEELKSTFHEQHIDLLIKSGDDFEVLMDVIRETKADAFYFNDRYELEEVIRQNTIAAQLESVGVEVARFDGNLLFPPDILNVKGEPYKIFTSFWKRALQEYVNQPYPVPVEMEQFRNDSRSLTPSDLNLPKHSPSLKKHWIAGERAGIERWNEFSDDGLYYYKKERDLMVKEGTSTLSPYLASGNISVKSLWHAAKRINEVTEDPTIHQSIEAFLRQLVWREFAYHQLIHHPSIAKFPLRKQFLEFPWQGTNDDFLKWKEGRTGFPLIDAGMRQLRETGIIHNRVRMVAASFLVKHLLIPWQDGYEWFKRSLVDFDMANNATGWQWVAGCGIDSAPYFRVFNPYLQSEKFDPGGAYIRKWVPELAALPAPFIHKPSEAPTDILEEAGIAIGQTYPSPMIDHAAARKRALLAYDTIKGKSQDTTN
ncbi:deoxyribodipyrimidine photo-lyase [Sporosarcina sp. Sa2YVA2]|uniref:Deoxyribodipyrimidine photo-lyase n=1 Tax=Sporosarcina quadrami TaxID=2762234 RepID=A0ABR8U7E4_9BACL|nr:deoxyribodipyrimidine photo-lyase [Sporosarcina quadrami]MBD7983952.1 deoxyribodipyrimidine photo-lyase [Sporosarcina quadrami]